MVRSILDKEDKKTSYGWNSERLIANVQKLTMEAMRMECPPLIQNIEHMDAIFTGRSSCSTVETIPIVNSNFEDSYTDLALENITNKAHGAAVKNISDYKELFHSKNTSSTRQKSHRKKILCKGDPGTGKTTFGKKVAYDWAAGVFRMFTIVVFVSLKLIKPGDVIESIIVDQYPFLKEPERITNENVISILEAFGSKLLLVLDGFDELIDNRKRNDIMKLIKSQKLMQSSIMVISRRHHTKEVEQYFDTVVNVTGFSHPLAEKHLIGVMGNRQKASTVLQFYQNCRKKHRDMNYNPLLLSVLCSILGRDEMQVPIGEIYSKVVANLYLRYTMRKRKPLDWSELKNVLMSIGKIAWEMFKSRNQFFRRTDVLRVVGEDEFDYGFLIGHEDHMLIADETADIFVTFLHPNLQEFLGAFFFVIGLYDGTEIKTLMEAEYQTILMESQLFLCFCLWFLHGKQTHFVGLGNCQSFHDADVYVAAIGSKDVIESLLKLASRPTMVTQVTVENVCTLTHIENVLLLKTCLKYCVLDAVMLRAHKKSKWRNALACTKVSCAEFLQLGVLCLLEDMTIKQLHIEESKIMVHIKPRREIGICIHCPHFTHLLNSDTFLQESDLMSLSKAVRKGRLPSLAYLNLWRQNVGTLATPKWRNLNRLDLQGIEKGKLENLSVVLSGNIPNLDNVFLDFVHKDKNVETQGNIELENLKHEITCSVNAVQAFSPKVAGKGYIIQRVDSLHSGSISMQDSGLTSKTFNLQGVPTRIGYLKQETFYVSIAENSIDISTLKDASEGGVEGMLPRAIHSADKLGNLLSDNLQNTLQENIKVLLPRKLWFPFVN